MYEAIAHYEHGYARIEAHGRTAWKTRRTAEKHAREYKATHLRDAWAQEV